MFRYLASGIRKSPVVTEPFLQALYSDNGLPVYIDVPSCLMPLMIGLHCGPPPSNAINPTRRSKSALRTSPDTEYPSALISPTSPLTILRNGKTSNAPEI